MDDEKTYSCSATLDLVCPPIPNSMAASLAKDPRAEAVIRQSDFYMICGRAESKFIELNADTSSARLHFGIEVPGATTDFGWIEIGEIPEVENSPTDLDIRLEFNQSQIGIYKISTDGTKQAIAGFTPDDVIFHRGRKSRSIGGLDSYLDLATYDLLYVGIAKVGDSYDRLFAKGHFARMQILANEPQRFPGARVSDETYLFLFKVDPVFVKVFGPDSEIEDSDIKLDYEHKRLVADAEKAFVHLLRPKYNNTLYPNFPKSKDGLYDSGLTAYTYSISEGIALLTKFGRIKGGRERELTLSNEADFILVRGDEVTFHISGVDFKAD